MWNRRRSLACWLAVGLALSGSALADDPLAKPKNVSAREHLSQGNKLYRVREFEKAIEEYKAGALDEDASVFHYNLGQCYRQLGKYDDAIWHYERFLLRAQPTGDLKSAVEDFVKQMKAEREKKAMTQLPIEPAPDPRPPLSSSPSPSQLPMVGTMPAPSEAIDPWYADAVGWGLTSTGLIAVGIGAYYLSDAADIFDAANGEDQQDARQRLRDEASKRRLIGAGFGIGGVGLLAVGIVKLVLHPSKPAASSTAAWGIGITGDGVQVHGTF